MCLYWLLFPWCSGCSGYELPVSWQWDCFCVIRINNPRIASDKVKRDIPEIEHHHSHISLINPAHLSLLFVLDCLKTTIEKGHLVMSSVVATLTVCSNLKQLSGSSRKSILKRFSWDTSCNPLSMRGGWLWRRECEWRRGGLWVWVKRPAELVGDKGALLAKPTAKNIKKAPKSSHRHKLKIR